MPSSYPPLIERRARNDGQAHTVIVCEYASNKIPDEFHNLGLSPQTLWTHIAWDPGAIGVARGLRQALNADLVAGSVSRLLYDCNRPPEASGAMPERSEIYDIPGNQALSPAEREHRIAAIYLPFRAALASLLDQYQNGVMITVHSFTPVYFGQPRTCEIGVLHDSDERLATAILEAATPDFPHRLARNVPYSAADGVTHTLRSAAVARGWLNVMLEIRNDLIETADAQAAMAGKLATLLTNAIKNLKVV